MDELAAVNIAKVFLQVTGTVKARIRKGEADRNAAAKATSEGKKAPKNARNEFVRATASGIIKFLNKVADDFNGAQQEVHVTMEDLLESMNAATTVIKKRLKK